MGKLKRKCCSGCPALVESGSFCFKCILNREIVCESGKLAIGIPYSKEPCKKPKSYKDFAEMRNTVGMSDE